MTTFIIKPDGTHWAVKKGNGLVVSNHRKKQPAISNARRVFDAGDRIVVKRSDGTFQKQFMVG